jgi:hypothetical protein
MASSQRPTASVSFGVTRPDSTRWKPSEILSKTRSVSAPLPGVTSAGLHSSGNIGMEASPAMANSSKKPYEILVKDW